IHRSHPITRPLHRHDSQSGANAEAGTTDASTACGGPRMIFSIGPEALATSLILLVGLLYPTFGQALFKKAANIFSGLARQRKISVLLCGVLALGLRAALLPILPFPIPYIHDEFSHLLAGNTFAHG